MGRGISGRLGGGVRSLLPPPKASIYTPSKCMFLDFYPPPHPTVCSSPCQKVSGRPTCSTSHKMSTLVRRLALGRRQQQAQCPAQSRDHCPSQDLQWPQCQYRDPGQCCDLHQCQFRDPRQWPCWRLRLPRPPNARCPGSAPPPQDWTPSSPACSPRGGNGGPHGPADPAPPSGGADPRHHPATSLAFIFQQRHRYLCQPCY